MANLTNEQREYAAVEAALAASNFPPKAYETLVAPYPVWSAMHACGVPRTGEKHRSVATGLFQDDFETCIDLNDSALYNYFKTTALLAAAHGQIKFQIQQRNNIRALVHWTKDAIRTGQHPAMQEFAPTGIAKILRKAESHKICIDNSTMNAVKPKDFTKDITWFDWAPYFDNYLRAIPVRTGVPLSYVTRENDAANPDKNVDFLDDYILNAPLSVADYLTDRRAIHTKLVARASKNPEAEALIKLNEKDVDGRKDWKDLQLHY